MIVVDASVVVDILVPGATTAAARARVAGEQLRAPAHLDLEVASALARMQRAGVLSEAEAEARIEAAASLTVARHELPDLLRGAWTRIGSLRVADALYVELAARLGTVVVTTDARLARATPLAELIAA